MILLDLIDQDYPDPFMAFLGLILFIVVITLFFHLKRYKPIRHKTEETEPGILPEKDVLGLDKPSFPVDYESYKPASTLILRVTLLVIVCVIALIMIFRNIPDRTYKKQEPAEMFNNESVRQSEHPDED